LDAAAPGAGLDAILDDGWRPTLIAFFATPRIVLAESVRFSPALFDGYTRVYVAGFWALVTRLAALGAERLDVFYPSTAALDEILPKAAEYAAAKAAGEAACDHLAQLHPSLRVSRPRLPRLASDQTASLVGPPAPNAAEVILGHLVGLIDGTEMRNGGPANGDGA
jgi:hypothetical protein